MVALALMIPGALIGLGLMNRALGLTSIFGLITLMGMIMRNEILIFENAIDLIKKHVAEPRRRILSRRPPPSARPAEVLSLSA